MTRTLREEIGQRAPFRSLEQEAYLNIVRTESQMTDSMELLLKPRGISLVQYNVMRILRGAEPDGLCRNELRDRMLNRMPDVTRLLDRMEEAGLVVRSREEEDRRQVRTELTPRARKLVDELDALVAAEHQRRLGHLTDEQLTALIELLTLARQPD
jgi:DNA-binding MarR family transcriptional regulator